MRKLVNDLTGRKFGRLTAIGVADDGQKKTSYICQCECGNIKKVRSDALLCGRTKSCGCLKSESDRENVKNVPAYKKYEETGFKVGGTRLYHIWQSMKGRCYNRNNASYSRYGGRGITVCDEWKNDFVTFYYWAISNGYDERLSIDRIDVNGNYEPNNCRWANEKEQALNRRSNIDITIGNATKTLSEWCEIFEVDYRKINARYKRNGFESVDRLFNDII